MPFPHSNSRLTSPPFIPDSSTRADGRSASQLRPLRFQNGIASYATGSTLIEWGNTRVICSAPLNNLESLFAGIEAEQRK